MKNSRCTTPIRIDNNRPVFMTNDELLALSAARIAAHYREVVRWVRSQPSNEQWQYGEYQGIVQRAFSIALEQP
jgi:hypothetical protein